MEEDNDNEEIPVTVDDVEPECVPKMFVEPLFKFSKIIFLVIY